MTINWYKSRAKKLKKALDAGAPQLARVLRLGPSKASLMTIQHALAKCALFESWRALLDADEDTRQAGIDRLRDKGIE